MEAKVASLQGVLVDKYCQTSKISHDPPLGPAASAPNRPNPSS
jgi:hypothetical protein